MPYFPCLLFCKKKMDDVIKMFNSRSRTLDVVKMVPVTISEGGDSQ